MRPKALLRVSVAINCIFVIIWIFQKNQEEDRIYDSNGNVIIRQSDHLSYMLNSCHCNDNFQYRLGRTKKTLSAYLSEERIIERTRDCNHYFAHIDTFAFEPSTRAERAFPLAFSITAHTDVGILEMLLTLYFRPTDSYCIHLDQKASPSIKAATAGIVACYKERFPDTDIFIAERSIPVFWGDGSILDSDLICFRELHKRNREWKSVATLAGTELPMVPIQQFRKNISSVKGNVMHIMHNPNEERQSSYYEISRIGNSEYSLQSRIKEKFDPGKAPCELYIYKGLRSGAFTRKFINFVLTHSFCREFYNWISHTGHPEEHFLATLASVSVAKLHRVFHLTQRFDAGLIEPRDDYYNPKKAKIAPNACYHEYKYSRHGCQLQHKKCSNSSTEASLGGYAMLGPEEHWTYNTCYRAALWDDSTCHGQNVHKVCKLGFRDLPKIHETGCMIANKFDVKIDSLAIMCQVKKVQKLTRDYV